MHKNVLILVCLALAGLVVKVLATKERRRSPEARTSAKADAIAQSFAELGRSKSGEEVVPNRLKRLSRRLRGLSQASAFGLAPHGTGTRFPLSVGLPHRRGASQRPFGSPSRLQTMKATDYGSGDDTERARVALWKSAGIRTNGGSEPPAYPSDAYGGDWTPTSQQMIDWAKGYPDSVAERPDPIQLEVQGEFPQELNGVLYRNGPGRLARGGQRYAHEFDGDGMISRFEIDNGQVSFRSRFVRTREYEEEERADQVLYRNTFGTQPVGGWRSNFGNVMQRNVANTNVLKWGDRFLALWEAAQPHRLNPETLETLGLDTINGLLQEGMPFTTGVPFVDKLAKGIVGDPLTAHPKIDYKNDRLVTFGYRAKPRLDSLLDAQSAFDSEITIYEFDRDWNAVVRRAIDIPGFCFVHDFVLTENYYIFFQNPTDFNPLPYVQGEANPAELIKWAGSPSRPTLIHVVPRDPSKEVRVLEMPACFIFHTVRGFGVEGEKLIVDAVVYPSFPDFASIRSPPDDVDNFALRSRMASDPPISRVERITMDLDKGTVERSRPRDRGMELPTANYMLNPSSPHRYAYAACAASSNTNSPYQCLVRIDMETGEERVHCPGPRMFPTEPVFVPKGKLESRREDDGWLLVLVNDAELERTGLFVYDAALLDQGPVGIAWLPIGETIPYGLHGFFEPK